MAIHVLEVALVAHYIRLDAVFRQYAGGRSDVLDVDGRSIKDVIDSLHSLFPGFRTEVLADNGRLFAGMYVQVNGSVWDDIDAELPAGATLAFKLRSIAGG